MTIVKASRPVFDWKPPLARVQYYRTGHCHFTTDHVNDRKFQENVVSVVARPSPGTALLQRAVSVSYILLTVSILVHARPTTTQKPVKLSERERAASVFIMLQLSAGPG